MADVLLITFLITLFYMAIANRLMTYVKVLALQGCFSSLWPSSSSVKSTCSTWC